MYCENCGSKVEDTAKFCASCGAPLKPVHMKKPEGPKETEAEEKPEMQEEPVQAEAPKAPEEPVQAEAPKTTEEPVQRETPVSPVEPTPVSYHNIGVEIPKKNNNKKIIVLLVCLCVVLVGAVVGVLFALNHDKESSDGWGKSDDNKTVKADQPKEDEEEETNNWTEKDVEAYVQACLDASYKGEFADYILMTGSSREEAKAMYDGVIENAVLASDIESSGVSQDLIDKYRQLFTDLYKNARYEITNVTKLPSEEFELEVTVWPFAIMQSLQDKLMQEMENDPTIQEGNLTEQEMYQIVYQKMYDIISAQIGSAEEYGSPIVVTVQVKLDGDEYYVPDEDYIAIDNALIGE